MKMKFFQIATVVITFINIIEKNDGFVTTNIQKNAEFTCLFNNWEQPSYVDPPVNGILCPFEEVETVWKDKTWQLTKGTDVKLSHIEDLRWTCFVDKLAKKIEFGLETSYSFSFNASNTTNLELFINTKNPSNHRIRLKNFINSWTTITLVKEEQNIELFQNGKYLQTIPVSNDDVTITAVTRNEVTRWKEHNYNFRVARQASENPTILVIPPTGRRCLQLYYILCKDCILEVIGQKEQRNLGGRYFLHDKSKVLKQWQSLKINVNPDLPTQIELRRKLVRNGKVIPSNGFWGIDLRLCPEVIYDFSVMKFHLSKEEKYKNYTCHFFNGYNHIYSRKKTASNKSYEPRIKCDITCEDIFGERNTKCEETRFASSSNLICLQNDESGTKNQNNKSNVTNSSENLPFGSESFNYASIFTFLSVIVMICVIILFYCWCKSVKTRQKQYKQILHEQV